MGMGPEPFVLGSSYTTANDQQANNLSLPLDLHPDVWTVCARTIMFLLRGQTWG